VTDLTAIDALGWDALRKALNQRVVVTSTRLVPSRVNRVWIVETDVRPVIIKRSLSGRCGREFEALVLAKSAGLDVPYPLCKDGDYLVEEYLPGESCETMINHMCSQHAAEAIGTWMAGFHTAFRHDGSTRLMADAVLSNFIFFDGKVYGVDLENSAIGNELDDLGQAAASILGSEPFFTPMKFDLCIRMLRAYEARTGVSVRENVRPFISRYLRFDAKRKPLFRRTLILAARSLERGWPELA
jgi:tRNA A-37 threonylcarbamoyl transferase component Bud32